MSHIRHYTAGRPPKAGSAGNGVSAKELADLSGLFKLHCGLRPNNRKLIWRIPFPEVVRGIQSIGGIAELAKMDRKTVYRKKLVPGSLEALLFVTGQWHGTPRPLVRHESPRHPFNLDDTLTRVLNFVAYLKANKPRTVRTYYDASARLKKWHRKHRTSLWENPQDITDEKRKELAAKKKDGRGWVYEPDGRVTVPMICGKLDWVGRKFYRRKFYRWKESLTVYERKLLDAALVFPRGQRATGVWETRPVGDPALVSSAGNVEEKSYDAVYDELSERIGKITR